MEQKQIENSTPLANPTVKLTNFDSFSSYKTVKPHTYSDLNSAQSKHQTVEGDDVAFEISVHDMDPFAVSFSSYDPFKNSDNNWFSFGEVAVENEQKNNVNFFDETFPENASSFDSHKNSTKLKNLASLTSNNGQFNESHVPSKTHEKPPKEKFKMNSTKFPKESDTQIQAYPPKPKNAEAISSTNFDELGMPEATRELRLHNSMLSSQMSSLRNTLKTYERKIELLEKDSSIWKQKHSAVSIESAKHQKRALEAENENIKKDRQLYELQENFDQSEKINSDKIDKLKEEYDFLRESLEKAEEWMNELENSTEKQFLNEAKDLLEIRNAEIETLHTQLSQNEILIESLNTNIKHLERENLLIRGQLDNNFDYTLFNKELEDEIQEKLEKQKNAITAGANSKLEAHIQEIERLNFELEIRDHKASALQAKIIEKTEENIRLQTEVEFLTNLKYIISDKVEDKGRENELTIQQYETELDTKENQIKSAAIQNAQLEALITSKDDEIVQLKRQVYDYDEHIIKQNRELNHIKFELNMKDVQISDVEKEVEAKENDARLQHLVAIVDQENALKKQTEEFDKINQENSDKMKKYEESIKILIMQRDEDEKKHMELLEAIKKRDTKIIELKETILGLETKLSSEDSDIELSTLKQAYKELLVKFTYRDDHPSNDSNPNLITSSHMHNPPSNESLNNSRFKTPPNMTSDLFGSNYTAVADDLVDEAVEKFFRSQSRIALPFIKRLEHGLYLIAGNKQNLVLIDTVLHVKVGNDYITLLQFLSDYKSSIFNKSMNINRPTF